MKKTFKKIFRFFFKPKSYLLYEKYEIVPAFELKGEVYYMHKDPLNTLSGRGLTSLMFMEELLMRCDATYLKDHISAMNKILSNPNGINIGAIAKLNNNLKERVDFLVAIPEHVYKLASIVFFTKDESPFRYDNKTGDAKIKLWQQTHGMYDFFLQTPLKALIPFLALPENNSERYMMVMQSINELHLQSLQEVLYNKTSTTVSMN